MRSVAKLNIEDRTFVVVSLIGCTVAFAILIMLVSGGAVRHVNIFLPEKTENTLAFRELDGGVALVGLKGIAQVNPTLIMRTGDYAMELTVINQDDEMHILYIDGVNISTKVLRPGDTDIITFYSKGEATYNYYDWGVDNRPLGQIKAIKVTAYE